MRSRLPKLCFAAALSLVTVTPAIAENHEMVEADVDAPDLVVAIAVDQLSADLFAQYHPHFTGGLARLAQGAVFPSGFQSHAATETCPGHATILTGVRPARSGMVANWWIDPSSPRKSKRIYCAEDENDPRGTERDPVVSAAHLKVPTLGAMLKRANPASRNVAVAAKDRAAMMMGGKRLDAAFWWKGSGFKTFPGNAIAPGVKALNAKIAANVERGAPAIAVPGWCKARDRAVPVGDFTIGTYKFAIPPAQPMIFGRSPHVDAATGELAIRLVDSMALGSDDTPDVLSVAFSATDYIGHAFGHEGVEMCIQLAELDRTIGILLSALDERGIDYVVMLTADHGAIDTPERLALQGYPQAQRLKGGLSTEVLEQAVREATGIDAGKEPLFYGHGTGELYLSDAVAAKDRERVIIALVRQLRAHDQVAEVFTAPELAATPIPAGSPQDWSLKQRARASFHPDVSGDVSVLLARGVVPLPLRQGLTTTHGSPWDYDRRVPILFWREGLAPFYQPAPVETVDIAPTLAALLGLDVPEGAFDGRCLDIDAGLANICAE